MKNVIVVILLVGLSSFSSIGDEIDYNHKTVMKTLIKNGNMINPSFEELILPKNIEDSCNFQGKFFTVIDSNDNTIKTIYIGRVNSCRAGGCSISNTEMNGPSEYFDYMVCFDKNNVVVLVKVFNYQATHGHEVTAKGWLKQFEGYSSGNRLEVGKNVDSISGATISVNGITKDIAEKTKVLVSIKQATSH
nr:FMN-binding protein [uncultured Carboxylicivirga sp.]